MTEHPKPPGELGQIPTIAVGSASIAKGLSTGPRRKAYDAECGIGIGVLLLLNVLLVQFCTHAYGHPIIQGPFWVFAGVWFGLAYALESFWPIQFLAWLIANGTTRGFRHRKLPSSFHSELMKWAGIMGAGWLILGVILLLFALVTRPSAVVSDTTALPSPQPSPVIIHPVFNTKVTGRSASRPAIQIDLMDESEGLAGTAELYLSVQLSRFPAQVHVILPINVGDFEGCRSRFVQLPFEVEPGDVLLFNLLDDDELSDAEAEKIIQGCRTGGYGLWMLGYFAEPNVTKLISPAQSAEISELIGSIVIAGIQQSKFESYGHAEYIVPASLPSQPNNANKLTILDGNHAHAVLRIYGPEAPVLFAESR